MKKVVPSHCLFHSHQAQRAPSSSPETGLLFKHKETRQPRVGPVPQMGSRLALGLPGQRWDRSDTAKNHVFKCHVSFLTQTKSDFCYQSSSFQRNLVSGSI